MKRICVLITGLVLILPVLSFCVTDTATNITPTATVKAGTKTKKIDIEQKGNTLETSSLANVQAATGNINNAGELQAKPEKNVFEGTVSKINFNLKADIQQDGAGTIYRNELGLKASQTLSNEWRAGVYLNFVKPVNNESEGVDVQLYQAKFEYVGTFFRILLGRSDLTQTISTMNYFGPYITAGQRYLDLVGFTIPIYLKAGVPEITEIDLPPMAISFYYLPAMLSAAYTTYKDRQEEFYLGQLRINSSISNAPLMLIVNVGKSTAAYFNYSVMSSNVAFDISGSYDFIQHAKVNVSFGIMNTALAGQTAVGAAGLELHALGPVTMNLVESIIAETQLPFGDSDNIIFNPVRKPIFLMLKNNIGRFRYFIGMSDAKNDYTLASVNPINAPQDVLPFGQGNIYTPENLIFNNTKYQISYYAGVGYEF
jgi:hypothetical protein